MRLLHARRAVDAVFDEANLVSCAGLVPVMGLAQQVDLAGLVAARVRPDLSTGSNPGGKAAAVVAGMCAGADSIDDLDVLRHGGMARLFGGVYAPSTLGSFLRFFTWGHALQLEAAARDLGPGGDPCRRAAISVGGPGLGQVKLPVEHRVPVPAGIGQIDRDLRVLDPPGSSGVLPLNADRMGAFLQIPGLVADQHRVRVAQMFHDVITQVIAESIGVDPGAVE